MRTWARCLVERLQAVLNGLLTGALYALIGMGMALIFGVMRIVNFAHGAFMMLGMYVAYVLFERAGINPYLGFSSPRPLLFILGSLVYQRPAAADRGQSDFMQILLTLGHRADPQRRRPAHLRRRLPPDQHAAPQRQHSPRTAHLAQCAVADLVRASRSCWRSAVPVRHDEPRSGARARHRAEPLRRAADGHQRQSRAGGLVRHGPGGGRHRRRRCCCRSSICIRASATSSRSRPS